MRKTIIPTIISLLLISAVLTGCQSHGQHVSLEICGSYAVPGMFCSDLKGDDAAIKVLETDSKGRILFSFEAYNVILGETQTATVICQQIKDSNIYFYEDACYILSDTTEDDIVALKENNSWEEDLDTSRMSKRPNKATFDLHIKTDSTLVYSDVKDACCEELSLAVEDIVELCFLDRNPQGQELYWLTANRDDDTVKCCVMVDSEYAVSYVLVDAATEDMTWFVSFKQNNGWAT